jgi:small subunit ribosomal protein S8
MTEDTAWLFDVYPHPRESALVVWVKQGKRVTKRLVPYAPDKSLQPNRSIERIHEAVRSLQDFFSRARKQGRNPWCNKGKLVGDYMTDPIADMLARLRNAALAGKAETSVPHSKAKEAVAKLLKDNGFVEAVHSAGKGIEKTLQISLAAEQQNPKFTSIKRLSRPGRRWYAGAQEVPVVKRGRGIVIISTSQGMMTGQQAKKQNLGGELICEVY